MKSDSHRIRSIKTGYLEEGLQEMATKIALEYKE